MYSTIDRHGKEQTGQYEKYYDTYLYFSCAVERHVEAQRRRNGSSTKPQDAR